MGSMLSRLGVQSYCFRESKTHEEVAAQVKSIGLSRLELCAVHIKFDDESTFAPAIEVYKKAGIQICSIGVEGFSDNAAAEEKRFKFAKMAGAELITCAFDLFKVPACLRTAEKLADKYDVNLGIHNHGGYHWLGNHDALKWVFNQSSPRIGLSMDTAWMIDAGHNVLIEAEKFADRLYGLHIKDFVYTPAREPQDVVVGTGNLKLKELLDLVKAKAPKCITPVLEYEGDASNPAPALRHCVAAFKEADGGGCGCGCSCKK